MPMLPRPYPDEVIGSVIERACYQSGLPMKRLVKSLFGSSRSYVSFLMASKLRELGRNLLIDADELLMHHTMFPYTVAYKPTSERNRLRSKILRLGGNECIGSVTRNVSHGVTWRRFCTECVSEDLERYGETYWRRSALLSKPSKGRADAVCSMFYNTGTVTGVPSRVKRFSTAARTCNSAT